MFETLSEVQITVWLKNIIHNSGEERFRITNSSAFTHLQSIELQRSCIFFTSR